MKGPLEDYIVTRFSAVELTGALIDSHEWAAMGLYLPFDNDGDGVVDIMDGRPIYIQSDARTTQPARTTVETGVKVGTYFLYYLYSLGGYVKSLRTVWHCSSKDLPSAKAETALMANSAT